MVTSCVDWLRHAAPLGPLATDHCANSATTFVETRSVSEGRGFPFLSTARGLFLGMPVRCLRTGIARPRPTRPQAVEGAAGQSPSASSCARPEFYPPCPGTVPRLAANAPSGLQRLATSNLFPGMYRHRWRPSNWLHWRSRQVPPSRPLDTRSGAPLKGAKGYCGRWHDRGVVAASSKQTPFVGMRFPSSSPSFTPTNPTSS